MPMHAFRKNVALAIVALVLLCSPAYAHVTLLDPNGGETLEVGSTFTVQWMVAIEHSLENWDLWYSADSATGPWITLAADLPAGSPEAGSLHAYDWTIPDLVDDTVWVRVRQDNGGTDYYDVSNDPFSIVAAPCLEDLTGPGAGDPPDGTVNVFDLLLLLANFGNTAPADTTGDVTGPDPGDPPDGVVDVFDLLALLAVFGQTCPTP